MREVALPTSYSAHNNPLLNELANVVHFDNFYAIEPPSVPFRHVFTTVFVAFGLEMTEERSIISKLLDGSGAAGVSTNVDSDLLFMFLPDMSLKGAIMFVSTVAVSAFKHFGSRNPVFPFAVAPVFPGLFLLIFWPLLL